MPSEVLYRKWRPQRFADVAGQPVVTRTLLNALAGHKVSHAYLFSGPRGTGKTTTGRLLAKAINCEKNAADGAGSGEPCNVCPSCLAYNDGRALDLIELDAASNRGIDEIRKLRENTNYAPTAGAGAHKVYLIDEVHMLTNEAFNALLKTLEEPPPHIIFILATTDAHKLPSTIVSRCQRADFKRIPHAAIVDRLAYIAGEESIDLPREGLDLIARSATGSLRDAINLLEQICDSYGKQASLEAVREGLGLVVDERAAVLAQQAIRGDLSLGLATIGGVRDDGIDLKQFQKEVVARARELLIVQSGAEAGGPWTPEQIAQMQAEIAGISREKLVQVLRLFSEADLRADPLSPLPLELALAESTLAPVPAAVAVETAARPGAPMQRPAPPTRAPQFDNRPAPTPQRPAAAAQRPNPPAQRPAPPPPRQAAPPPRPAEGPRPSRKPDLANASAEDIAAALGSNAPVIPAASENGDHTPAVVEKNGAATAKSDASAPAGLETFIDDLTTGMRKKNNKLAAILNGSCRVVSWQDGILTLGFFQDAFHKKMVEESSNRKIYEEVAAEILGSSVSIRCSVAPKPARAISPLVQHAVETHGATVVSEE